MTALLRTAADGIDRINAAIGRATIWLLLAAVIISAGNAISRKVLALSSNAMLEAQWYLVATVVMLAAPWVLHQNGHVRIEILSSRFSPRLRAGIELAGHVLMLMPFAAMMLWLSLPYFQRSFRQGEVSLNSGGLPVWPMRGIIVLGFALLLLQAVAAVVTVLRHGAPSPEDERLEHRPE